MPRASLVTPSQVRELLAGLPLFDRLGRALPGWLLENSTLSAHQKVELDLDLLLGVREVRCLLDFDDSDDDDEADWVLHPALDKPRNWMAGDRNGAVRLPYGPVREVTMLKYRPVGRMNQSREISLRTVRWDRRSLYATYGALPATPWIQDNSRGEALPAQFILGANLGGLSGGMEPKALEVHYQAGLSKREMKEMPMLASMVLHEAVILALTFVQSWLGSGVQKESAGMDNLSHTLELPKRDVLGVLGGEIKALKASYNELRRTLEASYTFLSVYL